jgi:hypothetical protein
MTTLFVAMPTGLLVMDDRGGAWSARSALTGMAAHCLTADPHRAGRVWCGTGDGLRWSDDGGRTWERPAGGPVSGDVSAVAVSPTEPDVVYAGMDPTMLHRSQDGGVTWEELTALRALPSAPTWSFPPRPDTSHVRWITPDPRGAGVLAVCIEAGALVRSRDRGQTWTDRVEDGPYDTHTLLAHPAAPDRLYSAAGDGFLQAGRGYGESRDSGDTWTRPDDGLGHHYLWGAAVDVGDPDLVLVSAASSPMAAHNPAAAESFVYRRNAGGPWRRVSDGLPDATGTTAPVLAAHPAEPGVFFAADNHGVFRSGDGGLRWSALLAELPAEHRHSRAGAIAIVP